VELALWEKLLLGAGAILLIFLFRPGIKAALEQSRQAEHKDWGGLWLPLGAVVAFVVVLILLARR
jgi:threonine/homoserine/homoserine lactone efflux protein